MKKIIITVLLLSGLSLSGGVTYNRDGSITVIRDGKKVTVSMDGKSVYGTPIKDRRSVVRRKHFSVEIIYSGIYSDMPLVYQEKGNAVLRFYKELVNQCSHWVYAHRVRKEKVTILMSNCMYSKTGYCGRKGKNEIRLYAYIGNKKFTEISFSRKDIIHPGRYQGLARKAVNKILSAKR